VSARSLLPLALGVLAALAAPAAASTRVELNGPVAVPHRRRRHGESRGWAKAVPDGVETVDVPHTWAWAPRRARGGRVVLA